MLLSSLNGQIGDQISFLSPINTYSGKSMLAFFYNMNLKSDDTYGALTLYRYGELHTYDQVLFSAPSSNSGLWYEAKIVCLPAGTYQLAFVGTIGLPSSSDITVDGVTVVENECIVETLPPQGTANILYEFIN